MYQYCLQHNAFESQLHLFWRKFKAWCRKLENKLRWGMGKSTDKCNVGTCFCMLDVCIQSVVVLNIILRRSIIISHIYLWCMFLFSLLHCSKLFYLWRRMGILEHADFSSGLICNSEGSISHNIGIFISQFLFSLLVCAIYFLHLF